MENPHEVYYCPSCGKFEEKKEVYANEKNRICSRCNLELLPTGKTKEEWGKEILGEEFDYYSVPYQEKDKVNEYLREKFVYHNSQFNPQKSQERAEYSRNFRKSILNNMKSKELKANATVSENIIKCPWCGSTQIQMVPRKWSLLTGFLTNKVDRVCVNCKKKF